MTDSAWGYLIGSIGNGVRFRYGLPRVSKISATTKSPCASLVDSYIEDNSTAKGISELVTQVVDLSGFEPTMSHRA